MDKVTNKDHQEPEKFQKKTSGIILTLLIGLIVVSFMFSGYESIYGKSSSDTVAKVGPYPIKSREFSQEYERQLQFFSQYMNGGNALNNQQIAQFRIQESSLQNLVSKKLALILGDKVGTQPSDEEIKNTIKELPYFKTNEQFDIEKYKVLLAQNRFSPNDFEEEIRTDLKLKKVQSLFETPPLSKNYLADMQKYRAQKANAAALKIERKNIVQKLPISNTEIEAYLSSPDNMKRVEALFNERKVSLGQAELIKARHILLRGAPEEDAKIKAQIEDLATKVTPKNFAELAKKNSQDPESKVKGGDLGFFAKGRMVPEFDEAAFNLKVGTISAPIKTSFGYHLIYVEEKKEAKIAKFEDHKTSIAKESLQLLKTAEVKKLIADIKVEVLTAMEKNDMAKVEKLAQTYGLNFQKSISINRLEGNADLALRTDQLNQIFSADLKSGKALLLDDPESPTVVRVSAATEKVEDKKEENSVESQKKAETMATSRNLQKDVLKSIENSIKVKVFAKFGTEG